MALQERMSKNLNIPYVYLEDKGIILCQNGVPFTLEEYRHKIDFKAEYEKRKNADELYDYQYAKNTGILRKKRGYGTPRDTETVKVSSKAETVEEIKAESKEAPEPFKVAKTVMTICIALAVTSLGCMYISTVHTATYLFDYVDVLSAWIMSAVITVYCSTAFEVVILFYERKRFVLACIFAVLWTCVVAFSMVTTVSVFYDKYNFTAIENNMENKVTDGNRLALEILQKKETALRESIETKKQDIAHRQSLEYATRTQQKELLDLQNELQENLSEQQKMLTDTPDIVKEETEIKKKESLFVFLGRVFKINGDVLQFIMSTLSAVFINLISPLSVSVVVSLTKKEGE